MSKNIIIKQDGVAQNITVDKLRTTKEEGGSTDWVPEEDIGVATLKVLGNGTYKAEDHNIFGFDIVDVSVGQSGGGASVEGDPHTGDLVAHNPAIQEGEQVRVMGGAKRLKVDKQGGGTLTLVAEDDLETGSLSVTQNGVYRARNDGVYAYSSVTVDVQSGGGGGGGGGGDDPSDLPTSIAITQMPDYILAEYEDGDVIDYTGMEVTAYREDGSVWTSQNYPDGVIPFGELVFPEVKANIEKTDPGAKFYTQLDTGDFTQPIPVHSFIKYEIVSGMYRYVYTIEPGCRMIIEISGLEYSTIKILCAGFLEDGPAYRLTIETYFNGELTDTSTSTEQYTASYTYDGKTVYYGIKEFRQQGKNYIIPSENINYGTNDTSYVKKAAWVSVYGAGMAGRERVPVQWHRPIDDVLLETEYSIIVNPKM